MLSSLQSLILGASQGVFEWIPVSSKGVNALLMMNFFGLRMSEALPISIWLHIGTLLAASLYLRKDLLALARNAGNYVSGSGKPEENRLTTFLVISTLLTGLVGYPLFRIGLGAQFEAATATMLVGLLLIVTGLAQLSAKLKAQRTELTVKDAVLLGVVQGFSALPGLSRSGLTVSALLLRGYDPKKSLKLSFLMNIPAVIAAEIGMSVVMGIQPSISVLGIVSAFVAGIITISALMKAAEKISFGRFCVAFGLLTFIAGLFG